MKVQEGSIHYHNNNSYSSTCFPEKAKNSKKKPRKKLISVSVFESQ